MKRILLSIVLAFFISISYLAAQTKKDGSPDMRYKENKEAKKKEQPQKLKKDGTPDMRYKANQGSDNKSSKKASLPPSPPAGTSGQKD